MHLARHLAPGSSLFSCAAPGDKEAVKGRGDDNKTVIAAILNTSSPGSLNKLHAAAEKLLTLVFVFWGRNLVNILYCI